MSEGPQESQPPDLGLALIVVLLLLDDLEDYLEGRGPDQVADLLVRLVVVRRVLRRIRERVEQDAP